MMENGDSCYLLKNADREEIIKAIYAVAKGKTYLSDEAASSLKNAAHEDSPVLIRRENEILRLMSTE
jgi:DNA-binding NarL/FixJ family response regulator